MHHDSEEEREMDEETEESSFQNHHEESNHDANHQHDEDKYREPSCIEVFFRCAVSVFVGMAVGFIIEKSKGEIEMFWIVLSNNGEILPLEEIIFKWRFFEMKISGRSGIKNEFYFLKLLILFDHIIQIFEETSDKPVLCMDIWGHRDLRALASSCLCGGGKLGGVVDILQGLQYNCKCVSASEVQVYATPPAETEPWTWSASEV